MARLALHPIGSALNAAAAAANREAMKPHVKRLLDKRDAVRAGWGASYVERVHKKGKLTAWERIERLIDSASRPLAVGTLVNDGDLFGPEQRPAPGAGVVTAWCRIAGRWTVSPSICGASAFPGGRRPTRVVAATWTGARRHDNAFQRVPEVRAAELQRAAHNCHGSGGAARSLCGLQALSGAAQDHHSAGSRASSAVALVFL